MIQFQQLPSAIVLVSSFIVSLISPSLSTNAIDLWCGQTPYPDVCKHFSNHKCFDPNKLSEFKKMARKMAMERALAAESLTKQLGKTSRNKKERAAWADCIELYQTTIRQLNKTLSEKCSDFDIQTWLSSALTNLDTCRDGFADLHLALPLLADNNVAKLISNSLAMNNFSESKSETGYRGGFPMWVRRGDRRLLQAASPKADVVVAQDGSGNYRTIAAALEAAGKRSGSGRFVIHVKRGVYEENLVIGNEMMNIMLVGDGLRYTIITGNRSVGAGYTTFNSATVAMTGERFIAHGITFRNTVKDHQAVALRSGSDLSVFFRCSFDGYQDTLFVHSQRQFYRQCYIYGTIDFIFGNAAVVLQNCMIYARKPISGHTYCIVTAQGRTNLTQNTGISIHNSRVMAAADLKPIQSSIRTYLGRPWKKYSRTIYLQNYLDDLVNPAGWLEWSDNFTLNTLYYGEYKNFGPGSSTINRVKWKGYRVITNATEASKFTVENFIVGTSWLPETGVPFTAGL